MITVAVGSYFIFAYSSNIDVIMEGKYFLNSTNGTMGSYHHCHLAITPLITISVSYAAIFIYSIILVGCLYIQCKMITQE